MPHTEAEVLFGEEGAQVLKHVVEIHKDMNEALGDVTSLQLITGMNMLFMCMYAYVCINIC
jgi:hypothetical protein